MRLADLRWWTVLLPALVIMGVDQARHQLVLGFSHSWWEQGLLLSGVLFATVASSQVLLQRVRAAQRREREAEALRRIGIEATSSLNLADIVDSILAKGREVLDVNCLGVSLYGSEAGELVLRTRDSERSFRTRVPGQVALAAGGASNDEPLEIIRGSTHQDAHLCGSNCRRCLIVPLKMGTESLGLLCAGNPSLRAFDGEKRQLALQIAALASAAVASGLLHERSRSVAILEERDRIAREMHDSLAQALGYISMRTSGATAALRRGKPARTVTALHARARPARASSTR